MTLSEQELERHIAHEVDRVAKSLIEEHEAALKAKDAEIADLRDKYEVAKLQKDSTIHAYRDTVGMLVERQTELDEITQLTRDCDEFRKLNEHHKDQFLRVNLENARLRKALEAVTSWLELCWSYKGYTDGPLLEPTTRQILNKAQATVGRRPPIMDETITSIAKWADETFGPCTPRSALKRALDEMEELDYLYFLHADNDQPLDAAKLAEEAADVCITLYRYIYLVDPEAINKKMKVNRERKWKVTGEGVGQHYDERETNP